MTKEEMDELLVDPREELIRKLSSTGSVPDAEESFIDLLDLTTRTRCALIWAGITSYEQIKSMSMDELLEVKNLGSRGAVEIKDKIKEYEALRNEIQTNRRAAAYLNKIMDSKAKEGDNRAKDLCGESGIEASTNAEVFPNGTAKK